MGTLNKLSINWNEIGGRAGEIKGRGVRIANEQNSQRWNVIML